jgi:cysteinyl-tRNA synthetase
MTLSLFDTMAREKRTFVPRNPERVTMYVCGPTVYNYSHIGNARPVVAFDVLFRLLRYTYGEDAVIYAANVTDVDDKINRKAAEEGVDISVITERYLNIYNADMATLGALPPTLQPRATETMEAIKDMIGRLVAKDAAYAAEGHVLFNTQSFADYGKLSGRSIDDMIAGARVEVAPYKRHPADFVLWKPSKEGEPVWDSPWGPGRPGWHIECSAMIAAGLGPQQTIDIHGGGIDLAFPHHENEIAQSEGAHHGHALANVWMHNGFLQVNGEKMSKSAGNFFTIRDLLADWPGEVLRFNMLRTHYRQPIDFTFAGLKESWKTLERWYEVTEPLADPAPDAAFFAALADDLNTPAAIASLHQADDMALAGGLGFLGFSNVQMKISAKTAVDTIAIADAIAARLAARKAKDFAQSDRIRDDLLAQGIVLKDGPDGTTWEVKK